MHALVRSLLDRDVVLRGKRYLIRSPTVREALTILASHRGVLAGEPIQKEVFYDTLVGWLPDEVMAVFNDSDFPDDRVVAIVFQAVNEGVPAFEERKLAAENKEREDVGADVVASLDWDGVVAEYMASYGTSLRDTMAEPWNGFLLLSARVDLIHARESLRLMHTKSLPYIKSDSEREKALEDLRRRAGARIATEDEKRAKVLAEQQVQLDKVAMQFSAIGAFGGNTGEA